MKKVILLSTTIMIAPLMMRGEVRAADCVATLDCASLGYTENSDKGECLKCPFGNYWACSKEEKPILGQCTGYTKNCSIGQILNNDGTCSNDKVSGKAPIGVVVAIKDNCGYAMTAGPIGMNIMWSSEDVSTGAFQSSNWQNAIKDFDVRGNMTKIIQASGGNGDKYPAAYVAMNYAPSAAPTSKGKWMLPTAGILNSLYTNLSAINNTISKLGGIQLTGDREHIWSSSEYSYDGAWYFSTYDYTGAKQGGIISYGKGHFTNNEAVRPVLAF